MMADLETTNRKYLIRLLCQYHIICTYSDIIIKEQEEERIGGRAGVRRRKIITPLKFDCLMCKKGYSRFAASRPICNKEKLLSEILF